MGPAWRCSRASAGVTAAISGEAASTEAGKTGSSPASPAVLPRALGRDVTVVRIVLVLSALVSGLGVVCYVIAWLLLPAEGSTEVIGARAVADRQGITIALALVPALVLVLLVGSALHANFVSSWGLPLVISAAGLVLVYRNAEADERSGGDRVVKGLAPAGFRAAGQLCRAFVVRSGAGVLLFVLGVFVISHGALSRSWLRPLAGTLLMIGGTVVLLGPWWLKLALDLLHERQARIRAEERADMAARVHDSVLQTLAMIQRSADQPLEVAKRLVPRRASSAGGCSKAGRRVLGAEGAVTLSAGVEQIERDVEAAHGIAVDAVTVGDPPLDDELRALLAAGREATVNAAKWSGATSVSIYVEVERTGVDVRARPRCRFRLRRDRRRPQGHRRVDPWQDAAHRRDRRHPCRARRGDRGRAQLPRHPGRA